MAHVVFDPSRDLDCQERFGARTDEEITPVEVRTSFSGVHGDRTKRWLFLEIVEPPPPEGLDDPDEEVIYVRVSVSRDELHELKKQ